MLSNTRRNRSLLAAAVGVNLALALAVGAGAVPRPGDASAVRTVAAASSITSDASNARQPGDTVATLVEPTTTTSTPPTTEAPPTTVAPTTTAKPRTTAAAAPAAPAPQAAAPVATTPAPTVPPAPAKAARRTPSAAEVQSAISGLKQQVGGILNLVSPTAAQIAQAGDQVCTAFDNGQTFAQVKATGLTMVPSSITVSPATVDWAVRNAVTMYCPGYASKLV